MPDAIFKFGADERNSLQAIACKGLETKRSLVPTCSQKLDRIPDYDKKCNIIAVQISRSRCFGRLSNTIFCKLNIRPKLAYSQDPSSRPKSQPAGG
ncbi:hypothetical protein QT972_26815 [Microcoleus sp. herbarium7]